MDDRIRSVVEAAIAAPSGENAQPWRLRVEHNRVRLYDNPESDTSLYNYAGWGSMVSHGAAIENMVIEAASLNLKTVVKLFPKDDPCVAELIFSQGGTSPEDKLLASAIKKRATNRRPFRADAVPEKIAAAMLAAMKSFPDSVELKRFTDKASIVRLARVGSTNEYLMLGNHQLHSFFFSHLTWTPTEDARIRSGFFIKTLELPAPIVLLFKAIRHWPIARILKIIGFPALVRKGNAATYASSAEIGIITIRSETPEAFILAGRALERIWLIATANGLHVQPLTGTFFMGIYAAHVQGEHFSAQERTIIAVEISAVKELLGDTAGIPALMYRMGYADNPTARSSRFDVENFLV